MVTIQPQLPTAAAKPRPSFQFIGKAPEVLAALRAYYQLLGLA